jgi:AcrR family transcriptional regulator
MIQPTAASQRTEAPSGECAKHGDALALDTRSGGRPRSTDADKAILRAAVELCAEEGFEGTTVEAVAARAGVGKATVYRRYENRVDLTVAAASEVCACVVDDVDTGSVLEDLRLVARGIVRTLSGDLTRRILAEIAAEAVRNPELREAQRRFIETRCAVARKAIERGIARGELRPDTDADLLTDLIGTPLIHRGVSLGEPVDKAYADRLVEAAVRGFTATSPSVAG